MEGCIIGGFQLWGWGQHLRNWTLLSFSPIHLYAAQEAREAAEITGIVDEALGILHTCFFLTMIGKTQNIQQKTNILKLI